MFWILSSCWLQMFCRLSFCFVYGFHVVQKLLSLIRSCLFVFAFISFALGDQSEKILLEFMSENILPMFCSTSLWYHILCLGL